MQDDEIKVKEEHKLLSNLDPQKISSSSPFVYLFIYLFIYLVRVNCLCNSRPEANSGLLFAIYKDSKEIC